MYGATTQEKFDHRVGSLFLGLLFVAFLFTHVWWAYPLFGLLSMASLPRLDYYRGQVRYFRSFEQS